MITRSGPRCEGAKVHWGAIPHLQHQGRGTASCASELLCPGPRPQVWRASVKWAGKAGKGAAACCPGGAGAAWREGGAPGNDSLDSVGTAELNPVCNNDEQDLIIK